MKHAFCLLIALGLLICLYGFALADAPIDEDHFPDAEFRALIKQRDYNNNNVIEDDEVGGWLNLSDTRIISVEGIEYIPNLNKLSIYGCNRIETIDLSQNTVLTEVSVTGNSRINTLILSPSVRYLGCYSNPRLTALDISNCTVLTNLDCSENHLTALDVSNCTALSVLYCNNNQLTTLDVSQCTALTELHCDDNQLTTLDVSQCTALTQLHCTNNRLTTLDVYQCTALTQLHCRDNQLTTLDVSQCTALTQLHCGINQLTVLDVSQNKELERLSYYDNHLYALDLSNNKWLIEVSGSGAHYFQMAHEIPWTEGIPLASLPGFEINRATFTEGSYTLSNGILYPNLTSTSLSYRYDCGNGFTDSFTLIPSTAPRIPIDEAHFPDASFRAYISIYDGISDVAPVYRINDLKDGFLSDSEIIRIDSLEVSNRNIASLEGIQYLFGVHTINCSNNQINSLDVSKCAALTELFCSHNRLAALDLSKCTTLTTLYCSHNQLESLDLSGCTALTALDCSNNQFKALDVSNCTALVVLECGNNQLAALDISNCTALTNLYCGYNLLNALDVSKCAALTELYCSHNRLAALDLSKCTALTNITADGQRMVLTLTNGAIDLSSLPGVVPDKVVRCTGGLISGGMLAINPFWPSGNTEITYDYDIGNGRLMHVTIESTIQNYAKPLVLPEALRRIEAEAFAGVKAWAYILPDNISSIDPNAFPVDAQLYYRLNTAAATYCKRNAADLPICLPFE